jgi:protein involved in sex pheromone biosynthesis
LLTIIKFQTKMKKVLSVLALASTFAFVACGPSAEEKAKADEKRIQDSIEAATAMQDSIDAAMQAAEEMVTDSTAADTAAATEAAPAEAAH